MRFHSFRVSNLCAVRQFAIDGLGAFVVVAGQNGCGKSCPFDVIRLLKSFYGEFFAALKPATLERFIRLSGLLKAVTTSDSLITNSRRRRCDD
jgi:AAA15 family ATPase/GTPase